MGTKVIATHFSNQKDGSQSYCNAFAALTKRMGTKVIVTCCHSNQKEESQSYCNVFAALTKGMVAKVILTYLLF